ncbi:26S proteasome non-ATPase regulatory subunit 5 [Blyttiomyces sp. JEL0837]|nr:26S proteasome non-ATPase regulatory subunit 5 [Blyttiomyces sp. JEL0837]
MEQLLSHFRNGHLDEANLQTTLTEFWRQIDGMDKNALTAERLNTSLSILIQTLFTPLSEEITALLCKCIKRLTQFVEFHDILNHYENMLFSALKSDNPQIVILALNILQRAEATDEDKNVIVSGNIFPIILSCLSSKNDVSVATTAINLVSAVTSDGNLNGVLSETSLDEINAVFEEDAVGRYRIYELLTTISSKSSAAFKACACLDVLQSLKSDVETRDLLQRLNGIQACIDMLRIKDSFDLLSGLGIVSMFASRLDHEDFGGIDDTFDLSAVVGFFAAVSLSHKSSLQRLELDHQILLRCCKLARREPPQEVFEQVLVTFGNYGSSDEGLSLLQDIAEDHPLEILVDTYLRRGGSTLEVSMRSLAMILDRPQGISELSSSLCCDLYMKMQELTKLMVYLKSTLPEIQMAAFAILKGLVGFSWGVVSVAQSPECINWLLNRSNGLAKAAQDWRYGVVKRLVSHPESSTLLGSAPYVRCKTFVAQGPFYVEAMLMVAHESM